jgi:hypothetical protein
VQSHERAWKEHGGQRKQRERRERGQDVAERAAMRRRSHAAERSRSVEDFDGWVIAGS